jgi:hypothetical protein
MLALTLSMTADLGRFLKAFNRGKGEAHGVDADGEIMCDLIHLQSLQFVFHTPVCREPLGSRTESVL